MGCWVCVVVDVLLMLLCYMWRMSSWYDKLLVAVGDGGESLRAGLLCGSVVVPSVVSQREVVLMTRLGIRVPRGVVVERRRRRGMSDVDLRELFRMCGAGVSRGEVGRRLGVTTTYVSRVLSGERLGVRTRALGLR